MLLLGSHHFEGSSWEPSCLLLPGTLASWIQSPGLQLAFVLSVNNICFPSTCIQRADTDK